MINLLPTDSADSIRYGRRNLVLAKAVVWLLVASAGMLVLILAGRLYINQQTDSLNTNIANANRQIHDQKLDKAQAQAEQISNNAKLLNKIFTQEIKFSGLLPAIGEVMPNGAALSSLSLTSAQGAVDLQVGSVDNTSANQVAVNLVDPRYDLFSKVDIISITCNPSSNPPCSSEFKALFSPTAQKRFMIFGAQPEAKK